MHEKPQRREKPGSKGIRLTEFQLMEAFDNWPDKNPSGTFGRPEFFVGQEKARQQLLDIVTNSPSGTVAIISEPLGAGKSTLIHIVIDDLVESGAFSHEECIRLSARSLKEGMSYGDLISTEMGKKPEDWQTTKPKVIFLEELDRKETFAMLQGAMKGASGFIGKATPVLVLSGDHSLRNPALIKDLNAPFEPIRVALDPLTPNLFKKAFEARLRYALKMDPETKIDINYLFDDKFLRFLIPDTEPPIATFRDVFAILQEMSQIFTDSSRKSNTLAQFSSSLYREYTGKFRSTKRLAEPWTNDPKIWHAVSWLHKGIIRAFSHRTPLQPIDVEYFKKLYPGEDISDKEYPQILRSLAAHAILVPVGIPYLKHEEERYPSPYLPSQRTILEALFNPLQSISPQEDKKEQDIFEIRENLERLNELYGEGVLGQTEFEQARLKALGLDKLLDDYMEGKIDKEKFLAIRKKILSIFEINS